MVLDCRACDLCSVGSGPIPFSGPDPARVAVLGEAPGRQEDEKGEPFVGRSGELLRELLVEAGFDLAELFFFNAASCFPDGTPTREQVHSCSPNWRAQLELADPAWVLTLGNTALWTIRPGVKISRARRQVFWHHGRYWMPTYHPSAALRARSTEDVLREDIRAFRSMVYERYENEYGEEREAWPRYAFHVCLGCGTTMDDADEHDVEAFFDPGGAWWCESCTPLGYPDKPEPPPTPPEPVQAVQGRIL